MNAPVKHPSTTLLRQPLRTDTVLLLDTSGSMVEGQPRRIDLLWRAVQALRTPQARWRIATFNTRCQWSSVSTVPEPSGMTDLAGAFRMIEGVHPIRVTVVTDGQPTDMDMAHEAGLRLQCPINILFVGDPSDEDAVAFCRGLCDATKGTFATEVLTVQSLGQTTATMKKMLGDGATKPSAIAL